ncbi:MAG: cytochrome c oxidase subunit II [Ignavibacteriaceae bacterium]
MSGSSNFVESVDTAFLFIVGISVALLVIITFLMIYFVIKYSRKRNPKAVNIHGNIPLEITWTVIPTILVLVMFWFGWVGYKQMSDIPEDAYTIEVTAQMWQWKFYYNNGAQTDTLYVPLKKPVVLNLKSLDVSHAFFVPAFRIKKDVYASRETKVWFQAEETGSFDIACAEYCGLRHSYMYTRLVVLPENDFDEWFKSVEPKDTANTQSASLQTMQQDTVASAQDTTNTNQ